MISLIINGIKIDNVYSFDDEQSILNKYALALYKEINNDGKNLITSPRFLRFEGDQIFNDGNVYQAYDIRKTLKKIKLESLANIETMVKLRNMYPLLNTRDIGLLWLHANPRKFGEISKEEFNKIYNDEGMRPYFLAINRQTFGNALLIQKEMARYVDFIEKELQILSNVLRKENKILNTLIKPSSNPVDVTKFNIEETTEQTFLNLPDGESLYDVFNALDVSVSLPFVLLVDNINNKTYFKICDDILPPDEWINRDIADIPMGIYFYVLDSNSNNVETADALTLPKLYSEGIWQLGNSIQMVLKLNADESVSQLMNKIINSLGNRINCNINETIQMTIKGTFTIPNGDLIPGVFADLVSNNEIFKYFMFFNEQAKSVLNKKRFSFYYQQNQKGDYMSALTVTLTHSGTPKSPSIDVRISRAVNKLQIDSFITIFKYLYGMYLTERDSIIKLYKSLYPKIVLVSHKKVSIKEENKKSRARLLTLQLQKNNADAFKGTYSEKCQSNQQPYLVGNKNSDDDKKKISDVKKILREKGGEEMESHGLLEWPLKSGDIYACYPREKDENQDKYIWPGVIVTKELDQDYDKYPYKPCCHLVDQYSKGSLTNYLSGTSKKAPIKKQLNIDRPLGENKMAPIDRLADLPYYLQLVTRASGYTDIEDHNRKTFLPIIRYGVKLSPDSLIHCLEAATNTKYITTSSYSKRDAIVRKSLIKLSKLSSYAIGKQELFGLSDDTIKSHLYREGTYIDPDIYVSILEKEYNCNIIVFKMDKDYPDGELVLPRYSNVHLSKALKLDRNTVIIVKFGIPGDWPYQCELVVKYIKKDQLEYIFNSTDPIIELISKIKNEINTIYLTSPSGAYKKYVPLNY